MSTHYLIHLPHCGVEIPEQFKSDYFLPENELQDNIYQYSDLYTDELFDAMFRCFGGVKSRYSRLFVDPERFGDDEFEVMHQKYKLGWFYENAILAQKPLRTTENKPIIRDYFDAHHQELNTKTAQKLSTYGKCTIIDCHSFSNERYWFHNQELVLPDICIGFEEEHVDNELVEIIKEAFDGYEIGINTPYGGSLVPTDYWRKNPQVKSVMIEINKKLYLKEDNITKNAHFHAIEQKIAQILSKLNS